MWVASIKVEGQLSDALSGVHTVPKVRILPLPTHGLFGYRPKTRKCTYKTRYLFCFLPLRPAFFTPEPPITASATRDKYMFHQANVIPTTVPTGTYSLLEYWYDVVMTKMATYLNLQGTDSFPLRVRLFVAGSKDLEVRLQTLVPWL